MTDYNRWDSKATRIVKEAEEEAEQEKAEADKALGLEDGPKGPPTVKAEKMREDLHAHSEERKGFIEWHKKLENEAIITHRGQDVPVELTGEEVNGKAVRISESEDVEYIFPECVKPKKLIIDRSARVRVQLHCMMPTSYVELYRCNALELDLRQPLGTVQVDECAEAIRVRYLELEHMGALYHQNSPGLAVAWGAPGAEVEYHTIGRAVEAQFCTMRSPESAEAVRTVPVVRGEGEFPLTLPSAAGKAGSAEQCEPEGGPSPEERAKLVEEARRAGNEMFRANDFMQAAAEYSKALALDPEMAVVWANRAQCWLRLGDHEKALTDAVKCTEVDPGNPKGWFRTGMSYHAMKRYEEAVPALLEAEKLEPSNRQVQDAIRMAQMMCRGQAASL